MEADLSIELREWYLKATKQFDWSKTELIQRIKYNAYKDIVLTIDEEVRNNVEQEAVIKQNKVSRFHRRDNRIRHLIQKVKCWMQSKEGVKR